VNDATDFIAKALGANPDARLYVITNYTALAPIKAELDRLKALPEPIVAPAPQHAPAPASACHERLVIAHLYPELLNLYGDGGNVTILERRARARGIDVEVVRVEYGQTADFERADIVFLGGGPDREQRVASRELLRQENALRAYVEDDGVLLAICGGYQILGREWLMGGETVPGLGVLRITTKRAEGGSHNRLVGNIKLASPLATMPVIGYENHAGRTFLDADVEPFGLVVGHAGKGNNDDSGADGARYRNVVGTYLHGPLLSKNPEVADWLIAAALTRRAQKNGLEPPTLAPLDDTIERAANKRTGGM
jgi:CobQ-like glutamine amidotransferase family enzyme